MDPSPRPTPHPLLVSFERYLRAANRADSTIDPYLQGVHQAAAFLDRRRRPGGACG
jgi:hypothetical protein